MTSVGKIFVPNKEGHLQHLGISLFYLPQFMLDHYIFLVEELNKSNGTGSTILFDRVNILQFLNDVIHPENTFDLVLVYPELWKFKEAVEKYDSGKISWTRFV